MPDIYFVDQITPVNPFSANGQYDDNWVELSITDSNEYQMMTGKTVIFSFKVSKRCEGWQLRAMDYVSYQMLNNRNVIISALKNDYEEAQSAYKGHNIFDQVTRLYEPEILIHSTSPDAYSQIQKDGILKSWNRVKKENNITENKPIGALLGDPGDFSDYVMLGGGVSPEIVVSSRQKGYICMDADCEYTPGARFYFSTKKLAHDGLLVRDGCHYKVKDELPITHALFVATLENVNMQGKIITPENFAHAADHAFEIHRISDSISYCGLVCKLCHLADKCDGCRSENNCCGSRKSAEGCFQYICCIRKGINGCWECDDVTCDKGMFSEGHDIRLRAFVKYIKENGKYKLGERLYCNMQEGVYYGHGRDYDNLGSIEAVLNKLDHISIISKTEDLHIKIDPDYFLQGVRLTQPKNR